MGTDIHIMVEVQRNGQWEAVKAVPKKAHYMVERWQESYNTPSHLRTFSEDFYAQSYQNILNQGGTYFWVEPPRNYRLFAILGNVRNLYGLMTGIMSDTDKYYEPIFNPISDNRGVPNDASPEFKELVEEWKEDGHSHSYVTLQEILDFDFDQVATLEGIVDEENYKKYVENFKPDTWYGYVAGPNIEIVSNKRMHNIAFKNYPLFDEPPTPNVQYYTKIQWKVTYRECCQFFLDYVVPEVMEVTRDMVNGDWNRVRFVFFFDN